MKIPARYQNTKTEDIPKDILDKFNSLFQNSEKQGIYLYGGVGSGKTHIIWALKKYGYDQRIKREKEANERLEKEGKNSIASYPDFDISVYNMPELLLDIRNDFGKKGTGDTLYWAKEARFIVLDDVGSEKLSDWVQETFYQIINDRYENLKPLIITSNFNIQELAARIGDRIVSRIVEMCHIIELKGKDRRMEKPNKIIV